VFEKILKIWVQKKTTVMGQIGQMVSNKAHVGPGPPFQILLFIKNKNAQALFPTLVVFSLAMLLLLQKYIDTDSCSTACTLKPNNNGTTSSGTS